MNSLILKGIQLFKSKHEQVKTGEEQYGGKQELKGDRRQGRTRKRRFVPYLPEKNTEATY
jgi:hypothetical protein